MTVFSLLGSSSPGRKFCAGNERRLGFQWPRLTAALRSSDGAAFGGESSQPVRLEHCWTEEGGSQLMPIISLYFLIPREQVDCVPLKSKWENGSSQVSVQPDAFPNPELCATEPPSPARPAASAHLMAAIESLPAGGGFLGKVGFARWGWQAPLCQCCALPPVQDVCCLELVASRCPSSTEAF